MAMADNDATRIVAHEKTYEGFIRLFKFGTVACLIAAFIVVMLIY